MNITDGFTFTDLETLINSLSHLNTCTCGLFCLIFKVRGRSCSGIVVIFKFKMRMLLCSGIFLLCCVGFGTAQSCLLKNVPAQENFDEKKVSYISYSS